MEKEPHQTMRIWVKTHKLLRLIAAHTDESMVEVMHRLAEQEYQRVEQEYLRPAKATHKEQGE